jgi:hypothetical protein
MKERTVTRRLATSTRLAALLGGVLTLSAASYSEASPVGAFNYDPITDPILSATFSADFAGLTAHRTVLGQVVNMAMLLDISTGLPDFDMSTDLFGTAAWPDPADLDQGSLGTGIVSASIDPSFFPALESGHVGLWFLATDTGDGVFAIDFLSLTIVTANETFESFHGWPIGNENNGFGIGLADGQDLPAPMPGVLPPTGTGFDEEISSKSIHIPTPATAALFAVGMACRRRRGRS